MNAISIRSALTALRILIIVLGCMWVVSAINADDPNGAVESLVSLNLYTGAVCVVAILGFGLFHFGGRHEPQRGDGHAHRLRRVLRRRTHHVVMADTTVRPAMLAGGATVTEQDVVRTPAFNSSTSLGILAFVSILAVEGKSILKNWL